MTNSVVVRAALFPTVSRFNHTSSPSIFTRDETQIFNFVSPGKSARMQYSEQWTELFQCNIWRVVIYKLAGTATPTNKYKQLLPLPTSISRNSWSGKGLKGSCVRICSFSFWEEQTKSSLALVLNILHRSPRNAALILCWLIGLPHYGIALLIGDEVVLSVSLRNPTLHAFHVFLWTLDAVHASMMTYRTSSKRLTEWTPSLPWSMVGEREDDHLKDTTPAW